MPARPRAYAMPPTASVTVIALAISAMHTRCCQLRLTLVLLVLDCMCARAKPTSIPTARASARCCPFVPRYWGASHASTTACSARDSTDSYSTDSATDTYTARGGVSRHVGCGCGGRSRWSRRRHDTAGPGKADRRRPLAVPAQRASARKLAPRAGRRGASKAYNLSSLDCVLYVYIAVGPLALMCYC